MSDETFRNRVFSTNPVFTAGLTEAIRRRFSSNEAMRVLEIGCGTGEEIVGLARLFPAATFVGVDISCRNIEAARERWRALIDHGRADFTVCDYSRFEGGPFDLIVSNSTLHLIDSVPSDAVFSRISRQLAPRGTLIISIPSSSLGNHLLWLSRRLARRIRSRLTDDLIIAVGRLVYRHRHDEAFLRERLIYTYLLPQCRDSKRFRSRLHDRFGLDLLEAVPAPHTSLAQAKHNILVFARAEAPGHRGETMPCGSGYISSRLSEVTN